MRLRIAALATALLVSIVSATFAQTGIGVLDVWLKARESADAPNDQKVMLYKKSKALVIGMDHYSSGWPQLSNGIKDSVEVAKALTAQGFEVTLKKDLKSEELDRTLKSFFVREGEDVNTRLLLWFSGHGYTVRDEGYIVPVDAPSPKADADFRDKAISLRRAPARQQSRGLLSEERRSKIPLSDIHDQVRCRNLAVGDVVIDAFAGQVLAGSI